MLQKLYIRNYAIIDELDLSFDRELNVITGETGAGKSIILGALSLILGERADTGVLINREEKCVVEAHFDTQNNNNFNEILKRADLDAEPVTIIRREISASGKSRAFVNDTPVNLAMLHELTSALVDLHRQFDNRALEHNQFLFAVIDTIADNQELLATYRQKFNRYRQLQNEYRQLAARQAAWQKEADYKQFLFEELEQAALHPGELEETEQILKQLTHAGQIKTVLQAVHTAMEEGEQPLNAELKRLVQQLKGISELQTGAAGLAERMESVLLELRDIAGEVESLQEKVDLDPQRHQELQERIDMGYRLLKKHGVQTTEALLEIQEQLASELQSVSNADATLTRLQEQISTLEQELEQLAALLCDKRRNSATPFAARVNELLKLVGMPNALLKVELSAAEQLHEYGRDEIAFLLDANRSGRYAPIQKSASGGELSRIMLCIKTLTAAALELPTLIFDEVDTGISGEAAKQVGILLRSLSNYHQVLCITHQPQIAGKGTRHYYVYKTPDQNEKVNTRVRLLSRDERIKAIAQMIGGEQPSEAAMENARELVN